MRRFILSSESCRREHEAARALCPVTLGDLTADFLEKRRSVNARLYLVIPHVHARGEQHEQVEAAIVLVALELKKVSAVIDGEWIAMRAEPQCCAIIVSW